MEGVKIRKADDFRPECIHLTKSSLKIQEDEGILRLVSLLSGIPTFLWEALENVFMKYIAGPSYKTEPKGAGRVVLSGNHSLP